MGGDVDAWGCSATVEWGDLVHVDGSGKFYTNVAVPNVPCSEEANVANIGDPL